MRNWTFQYKTVWNPELQMKNYVCSNTNIHISRRNTNYIHMFINYPWPISYIHIKPNKKVVCTGTHSDSSRPKWILHLVTIANQPFLDKLYKMTALQYCVPTWMGITAAFCLCGYELRSCAQLVPSFLWSWLYGSQLLLLTSPLSLLSFRLDHLSRLLLLLPVMQKYHKMYTICSCYHMINVSDNNMFLILSFLSIP